MKILFIFPTPKRKEVYLNTLPPIGMLSLASYLESKGMQTDVVDCHVTTEMKNFSEYDIICFSVNIANVENTVQYIKEIRAQGGKQKIIIGGPQMPHRAEFWVREHDVDAVVIGEGEFALYEYLTTKNPYAVKGIVTKTTLGKVVYTGPRQPIMELDSLPFPAFGKVPIQKYNSPIKNAFPISSIATSRGCPGECTFCFHNPIWRQRSAKNVVDEMEWQHKQLGVKEFWIADDNFTLNRQRTWDICEDIIRRGLKIKIQCKNGVRVDKVDYELLKKMKEAGVWLISVAPESSSQDTLNRLKKGFTLEQVENVVRWCKELDIKTFAMFIVGLPWENIEDLYKNLDYAQKLDTDFVQFARYTPLEGTPLYEEFKDQFSTEYGTDVGIHYGAAKYQGKISNEEIAKFFKKANQAYYMKPRRMLNILRILSMRDIYYTWKYAKASESM